MMSRRPGWCDAGSVLSLAGRARPATRGARLRLESDVQRLGAEGVVIAAMQLRASQRDCPVSVGRCDHIAEATLIGTAIARFSRPGLCDTGPALGVMPLGPQRHRQPQADTGGTNQAR